MRQIILIKATLVLYSIATAQSDETSSSSISSVCGPITCDNGGRCIDISVLLQDKNVTESAKVQEANAEASETLLTFCSCPVGYSGITCSVKHNNICSPLQKKCKSGRECVKNIHDPLVDECPCDVAYSISDFAGRMCEDPVTDYCDQSSHEVEPRFFCTNGGTCRNSIVATGESVDQDAWADVEGDRYALCECPPEFEGEHCEYLKGYGKPSSQSVVLLSNDDSDARVGFATFIVLIVSAGTFGIALIMKRNLVGLHINPKNQSNENATLCELEFESDTTYADKKFGICQNTSSPTSVTAGSEFQRYTTLDVDQIVEVQEPNHDEAQFV